MSAPPPPLIPPSSAYNDNYNTTLQVRTAFVNRLTDETAVLEGGTMSNITWPPTAPTDAITKKYLSDTIPGGPLQSIQFNDNGVFGGSANLMINSNILYADATITDGTTSILGRNISNLLNPVTSDQIATKRYVDAFSRLVVRNTINLNVGTTYTGAQVINGVIVRSSTFASLTLNDVMPTATDIIDRLVSQDISVEIGTTFLFILMNAFPATEPKDLVINLKPNTDITFNPTSSSLYIPQNYVMNSFLTITSVVPPEVTLNISSISYGSLYTTQFFVDNTFKTSLPYKIGTALLFPTNNSENTTINYEYTLADIKNSIVVRNPGADSSDTFAQLSQAAASFVIQNISVNSITLTEANSWVFRGTSARLLPTGSTLTIGANQAGNFLINYNGTYSYLNVVGISTM